MGLLGVKTRDEIYGKAELVGAVLKQEVQSPGRHGAYSLCFVARDGNGREIGYEGSLASPGSPQYVEDIKKLRGYRTAQEITGSKNPILMDISCEAVIQDSTGRIFLAPGLLPGISQRDIGRLHLIQNNATFNLPSKLSRKSSKKR